MEFSPHHHHHPVNKITRKHHEPPVWAARVFFILAKSGRGDLMKPAARKPACHKRIISMLIRGFKAHRHNSQMR
jgi:hypothetical protein